MIDHKTNARLCGAFLWLAGAMALLILLTSCSPLAMYAPPATATPSQAATVQTTLPMGNNETHGSQTPTPRPSCTVTACTLNMRKGAGMRHAVIQILRKGDVLEVIARGDWLRVIDASGARGYVHSKYCQVKP